MLRRIAYRYQRTLAGPADVTGVGLITGKPVRARFRPAAPNTGVVFARGDLPGTPLVRAVATGVTDTRRRTTLGQTTGVTLVEHVLAALAGLRIDNCVIELDGPEPPGLDGSAWGFVRALAAAGAAIQPFRRPVYAATTPIILSRDQATIALHPPPAADDPSAGRRSSDRTPSLRISYVLDYGPRAAIPRQAATVDLSPEAFAREVAPCRTFLLDHEAAALRADGVGRHLTPGEVLVFGPRGPQHTALRYADEPARHKLLDLVGDLSLCGFDLAGHVVAYRSGHALNVALAAHLTALAAAPPAAMRAA